MWIWILMTECVTNYIIIISSSPPSKHKCMRIILWALKSNIDRRSRIRQELCPMPIYLQLQQLLGFIVLPAFCRLNWTACEFGHNEARNPFIRWWCVTYSGWADLCSAWKKRISGGSHQRSDDIEAKEAEMSGNWVNDLIGGHKFSHNNRYNRSVVSPLYIVAHLDFIDGFDSQCSEEQQQQEKSEWEINFSSKCGSIGGVTWERPATIYLSTGIVLLGIGNRWKGVRYSEQ